MKELGNVLLYPESYLMAIAEDAQIDDTEAKDMYTLSEWLADKGIELEKSGFHKLANIVSRKYRAVTGAAPRTITRPDDRGKWLIKANGFKKDELHILEEALMELKDKKIQS
uniref:hypothetical protein n=1 Tax=Trichocoleus desertorum TaxID=1481672 RepID=UPI0025B378BD|nr:hypothetical protein [Trichocoleus desertorum]